MDLDKLASSLADIAFAQVAGIPVIILAAAVFLLLYWLNRSPRQ